MMAPMNRRQFEELRRWSDALRRDKREEMHAAGEAIRMLCFEVDRLKRELSAAVAASPEAEPAESVDDTLSDRPERIESSLRERLQRRLSVLHR
jgi:hypothetical protein